MKTPKPNPWRRLLPCIAGGIALISVATTALRNVVAQDADAGASAVDSASRLPPRPLRTDAEYAEQARVLRAAYTRPPKDWPAPTLDDGVQYVELGLLSKPVYPAENPFSEAKSELGRMLFFDPRLSGSAQIACASCHEAELGWGDGKATSFGHGRTALKRNSLSLTNAAMRKSLFWDGRAKTLEEQAMAPIEASDEMHATPQIIIERIGSQPGYQARFKDVFGDPAVTMERIGLAIATYERSIVSRTSAFDRFLAGEKDALNDSAIRGLNLFRTEARCANCHMGPALSDEKFHNLGLSYYGRTLEDLGRYQITKDPADVGSFRTPSLRNVTRSAPYMHNGLFDLKGVLNMYNAGMATLRRKPEQANDPLFPTKSRHLRSLGFNSQDLADLRSFLEALEELRLRVRPPALPGLESRTAPAAGEE